MFIRNHTPRRERDGICEKPFSAKRKRWNRGGIWDDEDLFILCPEVSSIQTEKVT
jgi:hypothetical protein